MKYIYGKFTDEQINKLEKQMHNDIHKLLIYKDNNIKYQVFNSEKDFIKYFENLLFRFGGLNELLGNHSQFISLMSILQAAYKESLSETFRFKIFRKAILDCHACIEKIFVKDKEV